MYISLFQKEEFCMLDYPSRVIMYVSLCHAKNVVYYFTLGEG